MTIEIPCMTGETVFADLRDNQKRKPKTEDLTECEVRNVEFDHAWKEPLFTVVRKDFSVCHLDQKDFDRFWQSDFEKSVFTKDQYFRKLDREK